MLEIQTGLMTVPEAAAYLRLKTSTVYHYVNQNKIAFYKLGSRVLFEKTDLDAYLAKRLVPAAA